MFLAVYFIVLYLLTSLTLYPLFQKAGIPAWKALVPGVNFVEWRKMIGQSGWKASYLLLPIANLFSFAGMCVDLVRSFGYFKFWHSALAVIFPPAIFAIIGRDEKASFTPNIVETEKQYRVDLHNANEKKDARTLEKLQKAPYHKPIWREWVEAITFAVFAASFIRMFLIEAYVIPSSSMEGSLKVGDYLFVSKAHYGIRTPSTVLQLPLLHNRIPFLNRESYLTNPHLGYHRLDAMQTIERNDPVVFNYPEGDSVYITPGRTYFYTDVLNSPDLGIKMIATEFPLTVRPYDKADHYIKRCVGIPGDTLEIKNKQLFIDGQLGIAPTNLQYRYRITAGNGGLNPQQLLDLGINLGDCGEWANSGYFNLNADQVRTLQGYGGGIKVDADSSTDIVEKYGGRLFPRDKANFGNWTLDNFGPIVVPKAGATVMLTPQNISMYKRIITIYEGNTLSPGNNGQFIINGKPTSTYTFKLNYYWMMGDNRHNSEDSRFWGFVPETHIVGKPLFIWFSTKNGRLFDGINFNRIFTSANKM